MQDVFYQLVSSYGVTEPIEKLTSCLFTVARNKIIDWYRKSRQQSFAVDAETECPLNLEDILFDAIHLPDAVYMNSMFWTALTEALDDFPDDQRQVFVMPELEGKQFKEIAEITGEPINTLLSRKRYAVLFLREQLREIYNEIQNLWTGDHIWTSGWTAAAVPHSTTRLGKVALCHWLETRLVETPDGGQAVSQGTRRPGALLTRMLSMLGRANQHFAFIHWPRLVRLPPSMGTVMLCPLGRPSASDCPRLTLYSGIIVKCQQV